MLVRNRLAARDRTLTQCLKHNKVNFLKSVVIHLRMDQLQVQIDSGFQVTFLGLSVSFCLIFLLVYFSGRQLLNMVGKGTPRIYPVEFWLKGRKTLTTSFKSDQKLWMAFIRSYTHPIIMVGIKMEYSDLSAVIVGSPCGHRQVQPILWMTRNGLFKGG